MGRRRHDGACYVSRMRGEDVELGKSAIGRPIRGSQVYVLDEHEEPVPVGVAGELYVGGAGVARGYLEARGADGGAVCAEPVWGGGERLYRTGDLGRVARMGSWSILGRRMIR